jgi:hypothetical protein
MVANWRLGCGALAFMMMGTQPAQALDWELIQEVHGDASPQVPVQKVAPVKHSSNGMLFEADMNTPGSDQEVNTEKGKEGENTTEAEETQLETILKATNQNQLTDNFRPDREEDNVSNIHHEIEPANSKNTSTMVYNGEEGIPRKQHSFGANEISQQYQFNEFKASPNVYRNESMVIRKWELVTEGESDGSAYITTTKDSDQSNAWELVSPGDEISVNEIIDDMVEKKSNLLHSDLKINQEISRKTKPNWLSRFFNRIRSQPAKQVPKREEPEAEINDAANITADLRTKVIELNSLLIAHLTSIPVEADEYRGGQMLVDQHKYERTKTSELAVEISDPYVYNNPVLSPSELIGKVETSLVLEKIDFMEQTWNNKEVGRAVPLIQLRF